MKKTILVIVAGITAVCYAGDFVPQNQAPLHIRQVIVHHMALNVAVGDLGSTTKVKTQDARRLPKPRSQQKTKYPITKHSLASKKKQTYR